MPMKEVLWKLWRNRWLRIGGVVLLLIGALLLLLPFASKYFLTDWLEKNGADRAAIASLSFNPFVGRLTVKGVAVETDGRALLENASMVLKINLASLLKRDLHLEKVAYRHLAIDLEQYPDGRWRFGSYTMAADGGQAVEEEKSADETAPWGLVADQVTCADCRITLQTPATTMTLSVDQFELARFTTREGQPAASIRLEGRLNEAPLALLLEDVEVVPDLRLSGTLSLSAFQLDSIAGLVARQLPLFSGQVDLDGRAAFSNSTETGLLSRYEGGLQLTAVALGGSGFSISGETLHWQGVLDGRAPAEGPPVLVTEGLLTGRTLKVAAAGLSLAESAIDIEGRTMVTLADSLLVSSEASLAAAAFQLGLPPYQMRQEDIHWRGKIDYAAGEAPQGLFLAADGHLQLGAFSLQGGEGAGVGLVDSSALSWQGKVNYSEEKPIQPVLELKGELGGSGIGISLGRPEVRLALGQLSLQSGAAITLGEEVSLNGPISLSLEQFRLDDEKRGELLVAGLQMNDLTGNGQNSFALKGLTVTALQGKVPGLPPTSVEIPEIALHGLASENLRRYEVAGIDIKEPRLWRGEPGDGSGENDIAARATSLHWQGEYAVEQGDAGAQSMSTDGRLVVRGLQLESGATGLNLAESVHEGRTTLTPGERLAVADTASLTMNGLELALPPYALHQERIDWQGTMAYAAGEGAPGRSGTLAGRLEAAGFQLDGDQKAEIRQAGVGSLLWQGQVDYGEEEGGQALLDLDGTLDGNALQLGLADQALQLESIALQTKTGIGFGRELALSGQSGLRLGKFRLDQTEGPLLAFDSLAGAELAHHGGENVAVEEVTVAALAVTVAGDLPLHLEVPEIVLAGLASDDLESFQLDSVALNRPVLRSAHNGAEIARLAGISLHGISGNSGPEVAAEELRFDELTLLADADVAAAADADAAADVPATVTASAITLDRIGWRQDDGLRAGTLRGRNLVANLSRDREGEFTFLQYLEAMRPGFQEMEVQNQALPGPPDDGAGDGAGDGASDGSKEARARQAVAEVGREAGPGEAAVGEEATGVPIRLEQLELIGDSRVEFSDATTKVPYHTSLAISRLQAGPFDSGRPAEQTAVELTGELENRAPVDIAGHLFPFLSPLKADFQLTLRNYPLRSLSAYTVQAVGTALASGQMRLQSEMQLADDTLAMENSLVLQQLQTETISPELAAELDNQLPIPLNTALTLLRDSEGDITLKIPLNGALDQLNVGIADVLVTALSKAIVPAATGYLMYTLGPYGALAYVGMKVGEKVLQISLPPVPFQPGESSMVSGQEDYLERIGKILGDRPETDIQLCPVVASWELLPPVAEEATLPEEKQEAGKEELATAPDGAGVKEQLAPLDEELRQRLLQLGEERGRLVKEYLAETYAIEPNRLLICDTRIETDPKAQPAVLLQM